MPSENAEDKQALLLSYLHDNCILSTRLPKGDRSTYLYTCFKTALRLEHDAQSKVNFIGTAEARIHIQHLLKYLDCPANIR